MLPAAIVGTHGHYQSASQLLHLRIIRLFLHAVYVFYSIIDRLA